MMTRSEAKSVLIAWKEAAKRINFAHRRQGLLIHKLSTMPELSGSNAVDVMITSHDDSGNEIKEPGFAFLPRGNSTSDPTARIAEQRSTMKDEIAALDEELSTLEDFYMDVLRLVASLDKEDAKLLHIHYCVGKPYTTTAEKNGYYNRLRSAVSAFQQLDAPIIPDELKENEDGLQPL